MIDNLQYLYASGNVSNRLTNINDHAQNATGYEGGGQTIGYDLNGNMISMPDKGISVIKYNHLNLPHHLEYSRDGIEMVKLDTKYRADGTKLRKVNTTTISGINGYTTSVKTIDYLDGFQYQNITNSGGGGGGSSSFSASNLESSRAMETQAFSLVDIGGLEPVGMLKNSELQFLPTSEGFYDYIKNQYIYQYKDHLGNTRVSFGKNSAGVLEIVDANDYYPFGMNHLKSGNSFFGSSSYKNYKYNGKELQETGMYDYGARFYMPDLGRWGVVDELAEKFNRHSPYNYVVNNPINGIDPDGRDVIFLADSKAVPVAGHGAVIVGNERDGWYYYSMNGTGEGSSPYGDSKNPDIGTFLGKGLSPKQAMLKANTINPVPSEKHHYDKFVTVKTTREEDAKIKVAAAKAASAKKYKVIGQSCACVMLDALNKIVDIRSNNAWYIPKFIDPAPNNIMDYFNEEKITGGGIHHLNRFYLPDDKEIKTRKVGKLEVGPLIPDGVDRNKTQ
ncbi:MULTISPECIES: RHS repeat domain-containing protein [Chryseobacterium]|uniref:RHS repeat-associated core domain-containing protein n=1 Tax=Candidatus Chryseobacterium massiliense TaxID=204089 RepID=A0A3D9BF46_9FLAO|nr:MULTISPECIES: RHS repeat-associated core domain-containing protein [Chryseobacterium]REC52056.1 hypothetical protein DRF68_03715 [Candidatus Chryseobacterium massiliae]